MKAYKSGLPNGLRVITVPIPTLTSATVTVWVGVGSRYEEEEVGGISHFLEHMVFKGSQKRPSAKEISEAIDAIGGEFNAGTAKEWTNFYIKARAANLDTAFDVLSDMVLAPLLKAEEIEREKGVIAEEIAMYEDTPLMKIGDIFDRLIFKGNPLSKDISGTVKTVKNIKRDDFLRYRNTHYYAENIVVTVAGGVRVNETEKLVDKYFGKLQSKSRSKSKIVRFKEKQKKPQVLLYPKKKEQAHFILGFLGNPLDHKDRFAEAVLATILGGGMSSRLFIEVRERRGLAYLVNTNAEHFVDTGCIGTHVGADIKRIDEAATVVLEQHYGIASGNFPISKKELKKAKEYIKGHIALNLEDTKDVNSLFGEREILLGKTETPEEIFAKIDKVTVEDLLPVAKRLFIPEKLNLAIIGPYKSQEHFEKLVA